RISSSKRLCSALRISSTGDNSHNTNRAYSRFISSCLSVIGSRHLGIFLDATNRRLNVVGCVLTFRLAQLGPDREPVIWAKRLASYRAAMRRRATRASPAALRSTGGLARRGAARLPRTGGS